MSVCVCVREREREREEAGWEVGVECEKWDVEFNKFFGGVVRRQCARGGVAERGRKYNS